MTTYPKNSKQKQYRDLRTLHRKLKLLEDAYYKLPMVKLDKPRFVGYKRFFVLRDDISRRKDVKIFRDILLLINSFVYNKTKDFSKYDVDDRPFHFKQTIKSLSKKQFDNLEEGYKKYFFEVRHGDFRKREIRYEFLHPFYYVMKIKQHHITEVPMLDTEMESQIDEIRNKINREHLWTKIDKFLRGTYRYRDDWDFNLQKKRMFEKLLKKDIEEI